jgi:glyoxylase-like metal-dependent hydrolase (beta-lactamase superfamily II)
MGITEAIDRGIWITRVALDEYDVRGALLLGTRRALVWDTLARPRDMRPYYPLIEGRELTIVYSHADWDHIWGTVGLPNRRAIVAHDLTRERFTTDVPVALAQKRQAEPGAWDDVELVAPTETFTSERSLDLGGLTLTLHHLPGHTPDCIVGFIPERGMLLAGDTVETPCPVVPPASPLTAWISELNRWAADARVRTVVPAHGPVGGRDLLRQTVAYLEGLRSGTPIEPQGPLSAFYRETHQQNLRWGSLTPGDLR